MISSLISYHCLGEERLLCEQTLKVCHQCQYSSAQQKAGIKCQFTQNWICSCFWPVQEAYRQPLYFRSGLSLWLKYTRNKSISIIITWFFYLFSIWFESQIFIAIYSRDTGILPIHLPKLWSSINTHIYKHDVSGLLG